MIIKLIDEKSDLGELSDAIDECADKISFLGEFLTHGKPNAGIQISERAATGFFHILLDVEGELDLISSEMGKMENVEPRLTKGRNTGPAKSDEPVKE